MFKLICLFALATCILSAPLDDNQKAPASTLNRPSPINPAVVSDPKPKVGGANNAFVKTEQSAGVKQTRETHDASKPIAVAVPATVDATKNTNVKSSSPYNAAAPVSNAHASRITRETEKEKSAADVKKTNAAAVPAATASNNQRKSPADVAYEHKPATLNLKQTRDVTKQQPQQPQATNAQAVPASSHSRTPSVSAAPVPVAASTHNKRETPKEKPASPSTPVIKNSQTNTPNAKPAAIAPAKQQASPVHSHTKRDTQNVNAAHNHGASHSASSSPAKPATVASTNQKQTQPQNPSAPATNSATKSNPKRDTQNVNAGLKPASSAQSANNKPSAVNSQQKQSKPLPTKPSGPVTGHNKREAQNTNSGSKPVASQSGQSQQNNQQPKKPAQTPTYNNNQQKPAASNVNQPKAPINGQQRPTSLNGQQTPQAYNAGQQQPQVPQRRNKRETVSTTTTTKRPELKNNDNISYNNENDNKSPQFVRPVPVEKILGDASRTVSHPAAKAQSDEAEVKSESASSTSTTAKPATIKSN